ncbi:MAG: NAD-dependent epimerase/dehydratase family protein [Novosphingobium sp.]|nr:NAD-dependent epimerase/dehydratase family protein [Novosphingobium sp.]
MKVLMVGGTGFVGGYTALYFKDLGHDVTIMSRSAPKGTSRLNDLPFVAGNYFEESFDDGRLEGYDSLVFCAGNDLGEYPQDGSVSQADYFQRANIEGLPRFFEQAKASGISRTVYMGSFYSFVAPQVMEHIPYVRSRQVSDDAIRALSGPDFNVCSCALPWIVGYTEGFPVAHWHAITHYAQGKLEGLEEFAPPGGANFMTCRSVAQAMLGGLENGESGKSYLVGDENLSWKDYFELWFAAAGRPKDLDVHLGHPIIPDYTLSYLDFGSTNYIPPAEETAQLGYDRGVLKQEVEACVRYYGDKPMG